MCICLCVHSWCCKCVSMHACCGSVCACVCVCTHDAVSVWVCMLVVAACVCVCTHDAVSVWVCMLVAAACVRVCTPSHLCCWDVLRPTESNSVFKSTAVACLLIELTSAPPAPSPPPLCHCLKRRKVVSCWSPTTSNYIIKLISRSRAS